MEKSVGRSSELRGQVLFVHLFFPSDSELAPLPAGKEDPREGLQQPGADSPEGAAPRVQRRASSSLRDLFSVLETCL